jgi:hypothetical protein
MSNKDCSKCVYQDTETLRCISSERYRDEKITDCCIPVKELRRVQKQAWEMGGNVERFIAVTHSYIVKHKSQSTYWRQQTKQDGQE